MDWELIFWTVVGVLAFLVLFLTFTVGRTSTDERVGNLTSEKNVDDMEDRKEN